MLRIVSIIVLISFFFSTTVAPVAAAISYNYDANGNMTSDGTKCYEYNDANQLKKVKRCSDGQIIAEYIYDYNGKRLVKKEYSNGEFVQSVFSPSDEFETKKKADGSTENTTYYHVNDELAAKKNTDGSMNYVHNDHLGSTSVVTDENGDVVEETKYEPYGEVKSGGTESKFGYTGQEKDVETGLNYYDARYYDPHVRRFTQPDTLLPDVYDPQQLNRYAYARNNPIKYTDPSGNINEILSYNNALNKYNNNPNTETYNNYLSTVAYIKYVTSGSSNGVSVSSDYKGSKGEGAGYQPQMDKKGDKDIYKPFYDYYIGDDLATFNKPDSNFFDKVTAGSFILSSYIPGGSSAKGLAKPMIKTLDISKKFDSNQRALIELAKMAKKTGISKEDAETLIQWAIEYSLTPFHDIQSHPTRKFGKFPHINIGPIKHIFIK